MYTPAGEEQQLLGKGSYINSKFGRGLGVHQKPGRGGLDHSLQTQAGWLRKELDDLDNLLGVGVDSANSTLREIGHSQTSEAIRVVVQGCKLIWETKEKSCIFKSECHGMSVHLVRKAENITVRLKWSSFRSSSCHVFREIVFQFVRIEINL
jgi:hypothetical protein